MTDNDQRISLVTGGTGGIGRAVARRLGAAGDLVLFTGRDRERAAATLAGLARGGEFRPADLSLLGDTARLAEEVAARTDRLDAVVCCAGCLSAVPQRTSEGLERTIVLNYLSRFLLIERLLPLLRRSAAPRIVLVASAGRYPDSLDLTDLHLERGGRGLWVSGRTQFANDLLAVELAERLRGDGIQVSCVDPGLTRTDVFRSATGFPAPVRAAARLVQRLAGQSAERAAEAPARLASAESHGGGFFGRGLRRIDVPERARDARRRAELWAASAAAVSVAP